MSRGPHHKIGYILFIPVLCLSACGDSSDATSANNDKVVNVVHHNEVFQTQMAHELNEEGLRLAQQEEFDGARIKFLAALEYEENNPTILNNLGLTEKAVNNIPKAVEYFERAIEIDTAYYSAYTNYGLVLFELKQYKASLKLLLKAIKYSKSQMILGSAHLHAAFVYYELNDCETSRMHFSNAKTYARANKETEEQNEEFEKKLKECK